MSYAVTVTRDAPGQPTRKCGDCQLCCKLLPMKSGHKKGIDTSAAMLIEMGMLSVQDHLRALPNFDKRAGTRCLHQRHGKGCMVYERRPFGCRLWNCRWLVSDDTENLGRPDRTHYVIDIVQDVVVSRDNNTGKTSDIPVIQIWVDPKFPNAHRDPALRAFLLRRAADGEAAIIRYSASDAFVLFAPPMSDDKQWHEVRGTCSGLSRADQILEDFEAGR